MRRLLSYPFLILLYGYRCLISPILPKACRFTPTCSEYAIEAFKTHLPHKACYLTLKRLIKCHPWGPYKFDPVPKKHPKR